MTVTNANATGLSKDKSRHEVIAAILLGLCMLFTGASGLVNEYVLATVSTYILGNSIEQFSITIALMLLFMGFGGWAQKFTSDRGLFQKFFTVEILLALVGGFAPITIYAAFGFMENHFNIMYYAVVSVIGFFIGFEIPLVIRINNAHGFKLKTNLAWMYAADYVGSFIGALVWVYVLLRIFPLTEISFIVAGCNFLVAVITYIYFVYCGMVRSKIIPLIIIFATAAGLFWGFTSNRDWSVALEQKLYEDPILLRETTRYQHIVVTEHRALNNYCLYINGATQLCSLDEAIYHEQLVHPVMALVPNHRRVLILGGGDGLALREVLKYPDVETVTLVDLDPGMVQLASTNKIMTRLNSDAFSDARVEVHTSRAVLDDEAGFRDIRQKTGKFDKKGQALTEKVAVVRVIHIDADLFLRSIIDQYNVVIIDFPDPNSIELAKLYSKEFFLKLRKRVAKGGMIVIQSTSPYHSKEAFLTIGRTMRAAGFQTIPYHDNVPSFGDWGWHLGWKSELTNMQRETVEEGIRALHSFAVETRYLTPDVFRKALVFGKGWLRSSNTEVSTLMQPVLLEHYTRSGWIIE